MCDLPESLFANPILSALETSHRHLAIARGDAVRYRPDVAPFAALVTPTVKALHDLRSLLTPGEFVWVPGLESANFAAADGTLNATLPCLQMVFPFDTPLPETDVNIVPLTSADSPEMVALTDVAFPGFFRSSTIEMGRYFGIRKAGVLIAMGGERLNFPGFSEISGMCTHPDHRGQGHAASLIGEIVRHHRRDGVVSWLHVSAVNQNAIDLYRKLGFKEIRTILLYQIGCKSESKVSAPGY